MLSKFATAAFTSRLPDVAPEQSSLADGASADRRADTTGFEHHPVQMQFTLTADRRRMLVAVENDVDRTKNP